MKIETNRKEYLTDKQIEGIFKKKMMPILNNQIQDKYNNLNQLRSTSRVVVTLNRNSRKVSVWIDEEPNTELEELFLFTNSYFDNQLRGMAIAKANDSHWSNANLLLEFKKGMRIALQKVIFK